MKKVKKHWFRYMALSVGWGRSQLHHVNCEQKSTILRGESLKDFWGYIFTAMFHKETFIIDSLK